MTAAEVLAALEVARGRPDLAMKAVSTFCPLERAAPRGAPIPGAGNFASRAASESVERVEGGSLAPPLLPRRLWAAVVVGCAGLPVDRRWGAATKAELERVAAAVTAAPLSLEGKSAFKDEFVTCGGVALKGVDLRRMESKARSPCVYAGTSDWEALTRV
jgi:hypothetical protein